jgi:hypothetical protein
MRNITKTQTVYKFSELSEAAKEKARDNYRNNSDYFEFQAGAVIEQAADIAELFGLDIRNTRKTNALGIVYYEPTVYYSGFSSQGDGACFVGYYKYKAGALKAIKKEYPESPELWEIVHGLQKAQAAHFYKLGAETKHRGHYYHSGCMSVSVAHCEDNYRDIGDAENAVTGYLRDFADWIYRQLEKEYEYVQSDEYINEYLTESDNEFDVNGTIYFE